MWKAESMLTKLPQLNSGKKFGEEMLIVSTIWKVLCDIFHYVECGKYNLNFPRCENYTVDFPLCRKNSLKFSAKLEVK